MTEHHGDSCPIHPQSIVQVMFANGHKSKHTYRADQLNWKHRGEPFDIAQFEVIEVPEELRE